MNNLGILPSEMHSAGLRKEMKITIKMGILKNERKPEPIIDGAAEDVDSTWTVSLMHVEHACCILRHLLFYV